MKRFFYLAVFVTFGVPSYLLASPELHVVGVYEGNTKTNDNIHGPEVHIQIDRDENPVILTLTSYEPVRWFVEMTPQTRLEKIILSGYRADESEVYLRGDLYSPERLPERIFTYKNQGENFRQMVDLLTSKTGVEALSSFHGSYRAKTEPFIIDSISNAPENRPDYLKEYLAPDVAPEQLKAYLEADATPVDSHINFSDKGFTVTHAGETKEFPVTLDVPPISWPMAAAYDPKRNRLYGVTLVGEGYIYSYDVGEDSWSILSSMDNFDAYSMIYDSAGDRLIIGLGMTSKGLVAFDMETQTLESISLDAQDFPGFADLYDPGNGSAPSLQVMAIYKNFVIARVPNLDSPITRRSQNQKSRTYLIDVETGDVTLVAYADEQGLD